MARTVRIMERRKLYNRVPVPLPSTTRWRHSDSVREGNCLNLEESLSFADSLLQSHEERAEDSIYLEDQAAYRSTDPWLSMTNDCQAKIPLLPANLQQLTEEHLHRVE